MRKLLQMVANLILKRLLMLLHITLQVKGIKLCAAIAIQNIRSALYICIIHHPKTKIDQMF